MVVTEVSTHLLTESVPRLSSPTPIDDKREKLNPLFLEVLYVLKTYQKKRP